MKILAVQLNLKNCKSHSEFIAYIESEVFEKIDHGTDLIVFPENINLCLLNAKEEISVSSYKTRFENFVDKILQSLNLRWILAKQNLSLQKAIILCSFITMAKKYNVNVITGSFYDEIDGDIYNSIYAIDRNGLIISKASKKDLVGLEKAFKIKSKIENTIAEFDFGKVGMCICFDLNDKEYISKYKCDILVAPSNGWRLFPGYPFDFKTETPQIQRAQENNFPIVRPYCAGWLGILYFSGRSMTVDKHGQIINTSKTRNKTELLINDINI